LQENLGLVNRQLNLTRQELEVSKTQLITPSNHRAAQHSRKKSEPFFSFKEKPAASNEPLLQSQIKSLQELCATQEKTIQKCVQKLQKKRGCINTYKQQVNALKEERANLVVIAARDKAALEESRKGMSDIDEDESFSVRLTQDVSEMPAPFHRSRQQSINFFEELSSPIQTLRTEEPPCEKEVESPQRIVSPLIKPINCEFPSENLHEIKHLATSTKNLVTELMTQLEPPPKRKRVRGCYLSLLTRSQLFMMNV
jgi:chromosome segregation ATPase